MGLRTQYGGRRGQGKMSGCSALAIPRRGPASPFKGHLSNKSNVFCLGSSRNLASQYLIRDHMVFHYNRILSAKAAVDCSVPKSRLTSIKFADQQRREKLKKKIAGCGEKINVCEAVPPSCSRDSGRLLPSSFRKAQYLPRAPSPYDKDGLVHSSPVKCTRKCSRNAARASYPNSSICVSRPAGKHTVLPRSHSIESFVSIGYSQRCQGYHPRASGGVPRPPCEHTGLVRSHSIESFVSVDYSQRCQGNHPRASGGDLLERHSEYFTKSRKPFTPRTLISDAKPFLSEYRFYTPARRKRKNHRKQRVEAQTQTDMISFPSADKVHVRKVTGEKQKITSKAENRRYTLDEPERGIDGFQQSILRETTWYPQKSSPKRTVDAEEEELLYLTFIEDVTNEILRLGLFSNRVLDQLFECHIEENKNHLDESKMRQMLEVLKLDLGCCQDSETELNHAGQEALDPLVLQEFDRTEELNFSSKGDRLRKATKSEEFLETVDLSLKESKKCESLSRSKRSRETQGEEDFLEDASEMMGAATESDFCGVEFEEHPNTSSTSEAALNFFVCDSDFDVNKELDELEGNLAEALHI